MLKIRNFIRDKKYCLLYRYRLKNHNFTILANNCIAGMIYHDLKEKFKSPTINLWINCQDYVKFVKNISYYKELELVFLENKDYPKAILGDITVNFLHYKSETEARSKWKERIARINLDNTFLIMVERDGCDVPLMKEFDNLPYKNKVILTHKEYPDIKSSYYIKGYENEQELGDILKYKSIFKRYYDQFDFVKFLNTNEK